MALTSIAVVNGPWQALSLCATRAAGACRAEAVALVDMPAGSELARVTQELLRRNGITRCASITPDSPARARRAVEALVDGALSSIHTIASYGVHRPSARLICNLASEASLLLYEDGLRSYLAPDSSWRGALRGALFASSRALGSDLSMAWREPRVPTRRVEHALLLTHVLGRPAHLRGATVHAIQREHVRAVVDASSPTSSARSPGPFALIVGQYYARLKQMREEEELNCYLNAARTALARGLTPVWRGHPRDEDRLFARLRAACPRLLSFHELVDDPHYPLECYGALLADCRAAVSFSSSSLFYLKLLRAIPTFTLLDPQLVGRMSYPHRAGGELALAHVPALESAATDERSLLRA